MLGGAQGYTEESAESSPKHDLGIQNEQRLVYLPSHLNGS